MKTLITIIALLIPSLAFAGMNAGIEAEYTFDGGKGQSAGGYLSYTYGETLKIGPQISAGIVDPGSFGEGEVGIYGDVALAAQLGTKLKLNGEVGYEYIHFTDEQHKDMYVSTGLEFPIGTTLSVFTDVKWRGTKFSNRTIGAGIKLGF